MADAKLEIKNIKQIKRFLETLPNRLQRRVSRAALIASAKPVKAEMKKNLNSYPRKRTGTLHKSIKAVSAKKGRFGGKEVTVFVGAIKANGVDFLRDGFYARMLEFGTAKMTPKPWARPALDATVGDQRRALAKEFGRRAAKEIKKHAARFMR